MDIYNRKILVIGIDGATWEILGKILEGNFMPYLKKLKEEGAFSSILSTIPPISPAAWGTIQTGYNSINNNIYEFYRFDKIKKRMDIVNSTLLKNTIWEILSKVGKRVSVVNVPMTYPPKKVNGQIVSGILTPSLDSDFTYPIELKEFIMDKIPDYQLYYSEDVRDGNPHYDIKNFVQQRIKNLKDRTKVCIWLLNKYKTDILMLNFQANDILQHVMWGYIDPNNKLYNEKLSKYIFRHFYQNLDTCIKLIREEFKRNSEGDLLTIILSDHGCEAHKKRFFLGNWLYLEGLLRTKRNPLNKLLRKKFKELILKFNIATYQLKLLKFLRNVEDRLFKKSDQEKQNLFLRNIIDWDNSYALSLGISLYGLIFILREGNEKERISNYIIKRLYQIQDPENGMSIVDKIYKKEEIYKGENPEYIPDLIIKPKEGYSFTGMFQITDKLFQEIDKRRDFAIGKHSEEGIIILHGESVIKKEIKNLKLTDIVPTILKYFNLPIPKNLDGQAIDVFRT